LNTFSKTIAVQTKRFTSHAYTPATHPETHNLDDPTRIEVQVPRTTFRAGEPIPVYATIPSPRRELVVDQGLRLRNVRVELIQVVKVKRPEDEDCIFGPETNFLLDQEERYETHPSVTHGSSVASSSTAVEKSSKSTSSKEPDTRPLIGASYRTVVAHSGASCRFHSSKPVRLRFILHQPSPSASPSNFHVDLPSGEYGHPENDIESAPITQTTLLHSITFRLNVHVSFVNMSTHMERFSTVTIPVVIIAPPATLPEVEGWLEAAYQKKHDRPPAKTVRHEDLESSAPHYEEGEAGPSFLHNNAPPPFEERDAPPPFFSHAAESSTSGRLPTFLESEAEIIIPAREDHSTHQDSVPPAIIPGEGTQFGFPATLQFDGHSEDMQRSSTPPPTVEMASRDTDLTNLTDINEGGLSIEALGLALERHEEAGGHHPPPPPPAMDDPSDPPPSIDSHFRTPAASHQRNLPRHPSSSQLHSSFVTPADPPPLQIPTRAQPAGQDQSTPHGYAPPPYLIPEHNGENEQVSRPPPYMG
jgi:neural Wiskott-Aldrich syndrome protein